jgi:hypothetical protein
MTKLYTVAGIATDKNGITKVRYANDLDKRLKVLMRDGFTNINFIHSDEPLTKTELCVAMSNMVQFQNDRDLIRTEVLTIQKSMQKKDRKNTLFTGTAEQLLDAIK